MGPKITCHNYEQWNQKRTAGDAEPKDSIFHKITAPSGDRVYLLLPR